MLKWVINLNDFKKDVLYTPGLKVHNECEFLCAKKVALLLKYTINNGYTIIWKKETL